MRMNCSKIKHDLLFYNTLTLSYDVLLFKCPQKTARMFSR
uniref:Uncharacterized protein n=1 Tax=Arundo donax TaxID=35708 RepID=A0A0A9SCT8_ARUDO